MRKLLPLLAILFFVATVSFAQGTDKTKTATSIKGHDHKGHDHAGHNHKHDHASPAVAPQPVSGAKMTFNSKEVDYGTITQGANGVRKFPFINDGTEPLIIQSAKGSCGCTVPRYPKEPILPGESAEIEVRYDTKRIGPFTKTVRMQTNAEAQPIVLTIKGKVEKEPEGVPTKPKSLITPQG